MRAAAAAIVIAVLAAIFAQRSVRDAVADFLGLAVEGERIERLPEEGRTPFPSPVPLEAIATPIPPADAPGILGLEPRLPDGDPIAVYRVRWLSTDVIVYRYPDFDLWQVPAGRANFGKGVESGIIEEVTVGGAPGYWLAEGIRLVSYLDSNGTVVAGSQRTIFTNVLVWTANSIYYRIEGDLTLEQALSIANSLE